MEEKKKSNFVIWLEEELKQRNMTPAQLARRAGVTRGTITNVMKGHRGPGEKLYQGIAKAFDIPPEIVYQNAGVLPPVDRSDELDAIILAKLQRYQDQPERKEYILALIETTIEQDEKAFKKKEEPLVPVAN